MCELCGSVCLSTHFHWWSQKQFKPALLLLRLHHLFRVQINYPKHFMIWNAAAVCRVNGKFAPTLLNCVELLLFVYVCVCVNIGCSLLQTDEMMRLVLSDCNTTEGMYRFNNLHRMWSVIDVAFKWKYSDWLKEYAWCFFSFVFYCCLSIRWKECDE